MLVLQGVQGPHAQHRTCFSLWLLPCKPSPAPPGTTTAGRIDQTRHWRASRRRLPSCRPAPQLSFHPQRPRPRLRRPVRLRCEGQDDGDSSSSAGGGGGGGKRPPKKQSGKPFQWLRQALSGLRTQRAARVVFNVGALLLLMRLWPLNGRHPLSGDGATIPIDVPFSTFVRNVRQNEVLAVAIDRRALSYRLRPQAVPKMFPKSAGQLPAGAAVLLRTLRPGDYATPYDAMLKNGVQFSAVEKQQSMLMTVSMYFLYVCLLLGALNRLPIKLPRRGAGRRHSTAAAAAAAITFDDVAGVDEAKEELSEIVELLRAPERFTKLGARAPSGVLLIGPPGTGKTLLARAVAGEADVPFFSISASEFVELYVGMGAMRVRELFASARKEAPAIVFIDEIDAVAKGRDTRLRSVGNDEREQTLNQLLTELDGFESGSGEAGPVICIAATNRPDVLDAALLRPGRFDRRVTVERPDRTGREQILRVHIARRALPLADDVSVTGIASSTTGFTGADLANLVNEAALLAGRSSKGTVGSEDFDRAILRAVAGIEKKRSILVGMEKAVVARHEAGHAIVSTAVQICIPAGAAVEKLSIIPRTGGALGFTYIPPRTEDRALMFDTEIRGQMAMLMGGRAAEELTCGQVSTGAVDDIRRASSLAYQTVSEFGLCPAVGPLSISALAAGGPDEGAPLFGRDTGLSRLVENEAKKLVEAALAVAKDIVQANIKAHDGLSRELEAKERLEGPDLARWLAQVVAPASLRAFILQGAMPALGRR